MLTKLKVWFISLLTLLNTTKTVPSAAKEEKLLKLDLQFFADDEDDHDDEEHHEEDEEDGEEIPNLDELLKNPKFKKQYNEKMKGQLGKRMSKYKDVDPEEYRRLKAKEQAGNKNGKDDDENKGETRSTENEKRLLRAERREKTALVKEFAVDNGHNPKLLARLMNIDAIELDEDGNADNLEELFEELEEEFPEYFSQQEEAEDGIVEQPKKRAGVHSLPEKKSNPKKKVDPAEIGRQKARERHKKKEDK